MFISRSQPDRQDRDSDEKTVERATPTFDESKKRRLLVGMNQPVPARVESELDKAIEDDPLLRALIKPERGVERGNGHKNGRVG